MRMARSGSRVPRTRPTTMASASAATIPSVEPSQVPTTPWVVARVTVASMVLSPSSARKNTVPTLSTALRPERAARASSSSDNRSPRTVHAPKPRNARPATKATARSGIAAPTAAPTATDSRCTTAVATVIPVSTTAARYRVANARAINWLLSPSSATKMTPKLSRNACSTPVTLVAGGAQRVDTSTVRDVDFVPFLTVTTTRHEPLVRVRTLDPVDEHFDVPDTTRTLTFAPSDGFTPAAAARADDDSDFPFFTNANPDTRWAIFTFNVGEEWV